MSPRWFEPFLFERPSRLGIRPTPDVVLQDPRSRELLRDVRLDAADYMRSAVARVEEGAWADALTELQIAEDRLQFAEQLEQELRTTYGE